MLSKQQKFTLSLLKDLAGITEPKDIVKWCLTKINKTSKKRKIHTLEGKKHYASKAYFREIINYFQDK